MKKGMYKYPVWISGTEKEACARLIITRSDAFIHYGDCYDSKLTHEVQRFLQGLGDNSEIVCKHIARVVSRVANEVVLHNACYRDFSLVLRASMPCDAYNVPRWHRDGLPKHRVDVTAPVYKSVLTLKGSLTRFGEVIDAEAFEATEREAQSLFDQYYVQDHAVYMEREIERRTRACQFVREFVPTVESEIVAFCVGADHAVIHAEPPLSEPRLFMFLV